MFDATKVLIPFPKKIEDKKKDVVIGVTNNPYYVLEANGEGFVFEEAIKSEYQNRILDVPAGTVATAIYEGAADSQMSLYSFFHTGMKNYAEKQSMNEAIEWLKNIDTQLVEMGSKSHTGTLRTNWIHNDIKQAIESLSKRAQDTSTDSDVDM